MAFIEMFSGYVIQVFGRVTPLIIFALLVISSTDGKSAVSQDLHIACSSSLASNTIKKWLTCKKWSEGTWKYSHQMHRHVLQLDRGKKSQCNAVLSSYDSQLIQWNVTHRQVRVVPQKFLIVSFFSPPPFHSLQDLYLILWLHWGPCF